MRIVVSCDYLMCMCVWVYVYIGILLRIPTRYMNKTRECPTKARRTFLEDIPLSVSYIIVKHCDIDE